MSETLEVQIEKAWDMLLKMPPRRRRTLYLTTARRVVWSSNDVRASHLMEVGTYDRSITLEHLRADVFHVNDQYTKQFKKVA
ncbi:hypothetical protein [Lysobacter auxotrophicus]|uniref:Uncharacterized protein n=1 Tax=Lysobacter auxotrophicus TaxID=2992573 RepID=A0ABM8DG12_9GAMM|nr:hypothetical protein [Lysobacter auxotrophicus]BDU17542.1 hypothetical protein LA521A_27430 [Lysobacter auxotrophicus]